jgi:hypothetical protein
MTTVLVTSTIGEIGSEAARVLTRVAGFSSSIQSVLFSQFESPLEAWMER